MLLLATGHILKLTDMKHIFNTGSQLLVYLHGNDTFL